MPGSVFDEQYYPTTEKEPGSIFRQSKLLDPKKSFYQTDFKPISKLSAIQNKRKRKNKLGKTNIAAFDENQATSLVYINPVSNNQEYSIPSQLNQPYFKKESGSVRNSDITPYSPQMNPIQVVEREKAKVFKDNFLLANTNKIRYEINFGHIEINYKALNDSCI